MIGKFFLYNDQRLRFNIIIIIRSGKLKKGAYIIGTARQYDDEPDSFWDNVVWSDESKFNIFSSVSAQNSQKLRTPNKALNIQNLTSTL